ncbi:MAG: Fe(2+) transporter permease subunit FeoB [Pseudomonadota bacterium]|jgi:ferrous iron transport protein B
MTDFIIGVVGNPNCGKTTLFNELTGSKQEVGNWPGVTVEKKTGHYRFENKTIETVDLPGTYSLDTAIGYTSTDEQVAQFYVLSGEADLIVNIVDATNLERNLYLTTQLLEMNVPILMSVNMMDIAKQQNIQIDISLLAERLGIPIIPLIASDGHGIEHLKHEINQAANINTPPNRFVVYHDAIEQAITKLAILLKKELSIIQQTHSRWFAIKLLEEGHLLNINISEEIKQLSLQYREQIEQELGEEIDILIAEGRYHFIEEMVNGAVIRPDHINQQLSDRIDNIVLNRILGIPIFLSIMYLMFMFTINVGGIFVDFFDILANTLLVDGLSYLLTQWQFPIWLITLFTNGIGGGIQTVSTFVPIIGFLFLFLSILEDSGYMARAAFVMDRFMRFIGLPGKSFVPMIVGFGCNVPAVMATRTLESERDRRLTILMNPFMSCGARLPVYALFAAAFFPTNGQNIIFGLYLTGIAVAIFTGLIMKHTLLRGEAGYFVMELPPYHLPTIKGILFRTWDRLKGFIIRAGQIIVPMVIVISFLNSYGTDGSYGNNNSDKSVLSEIGRTLTPVFAPMGIKEDNWAATVGIFTGILAKEVIVGTLDAIYSQLSENKEKSNEQSPSFNLVEGINKAFKTIPENMSKLGKTLFDPLNLETASEKTQEINTKTFNEMITRFGSEAAAFAYLLFILMYFPCTATTASIYRETGLKWAIFVVCWTTGLAYLSAVIFYQSSQFIAHPSQSLMWITSLLAVFVSVLITLYVIGRQNPQRRIMV